MIKGKTLKKTLFLITFSFLLGNQVNAGLIKPQPKPQEFKIQQIKPIKKSISKPAKKQITKPTSKKTAPKIASPKKVVPKKIQQKTMEQNTSLFHHEAQIFIKNSVQKYN